MARAVGGAPAPVRLRVARTQARREGEWCERIRGWFPPFIQGGGAGGMAQGGGRRAHRRPPSRLGGDLGAWPLREGEEGEGAGWCRVSARRTRGEGEEVRGRGRGAGEVVAGVKPLSGSCQLSPAGTSLTGGAHRSDRCWSIDSRFGVPLFSRVGRLCVGS
jgi:hypothetical protein